MGFNWGSAAIVPEEKGYWNGFLKLIQYLSAIVRTVNRGDKIAKLIFSRPQPRPLGHLLIGNAMLSTAGRMKKKCVINIFRGHNRICWRSKIGLMKPPMQCSEKRFFKIIFQNNGFNLVSLLWPQREGRKRKNLGLRRVVWVCSNHRWWGETSYLT